MAAPGSARNNILVIKLGALGDVVQALGPMAAIRRDHAGDRISVLTTAPYAELIRAAGVADDIIVDERPRFAEFGKWLALRKSLRNGDFARVYDLQTSDRSSSYFRLFWPGAKPEWSGVAKGCSHPHDNPKRDFMHTIERQAEQLAMAGIEDVPLPELSPITSDVTHLKLPRRFCLIVPGGAEHRPAKRWPREHYYELIKKLDGTGVVPVVCGTEAERPLAAALIEGAIAARNIAGETSLVDLVTVAKRAAFALGNDNGTMHIAAFAGIPSVVLYSDASDPALCAQRGPDVTILRRQPLSALSVDEVFAALPHEAGS
ncbi:MAG: glycosyltransferase family 9 protein [Rhodospirillales bacterium]|nr:glycosyltransferase family 9 protein [Rhodospirillales bacterium]MBO6788606.1 glycosyltransferase family 9 protein [Rhodospirillales bacterium]